jgi:ABC-type glutathione transport system ATPase component
MYALIVLPVLAALVLIVVCIVKYVVIPLREKERVYAYNDNFMATTEGIKVYHHQDTKLNYNIKQVEGSVDQPQLPAPEVHRPTQEFAIGQLRENGLNVCLGVSKETGEPFVLDLIDGTHYKIIGSSGKGKSCLAGSVLDQVTTVNSPEQLAVALLDAEHKTSRLFENLPHVASMNLGRRHIDCVAQSPDEVAEHFGHLHRELDRRAKLSETDLQRERFLLIYVEEFLIPTCVLRDNSPMRYDARLPVWDLYQ